MGYVKNNLMQGECVVHKASIHWFIFLPSIILTVIGIVVFQLMQPALSSTFSITLSNSINESFHSNFGSAFVSKLISWPLTIIDAIFILLGAVSALVAIIEVISTELAVTSKRVIAKIGFIQRHAIEINHGKVEGFEIDQGIFGRIFDFGTVLVNGTGGAKTPRIPNIASPRRETGCFPDPCVAVGPGVFPAVATLHRKPEGKHKANRNGVKPFVEPSGDAQVPLGTKRYRPADERRAYAGGVLAKVVAKFLAPEIGLDPISGLVKIDDSPLEFRRNASAAIQRQKEFEAFHHSHVPRLQALQQDAAGKLGLPVVFQDRLSSGGLGPKMAVLPAGSFMMGSPPDEPERRPDEGPQHRVSFARPFATGVYAVTFDEHDRFCEVTGQDPCRGTVDGGLGRGQRPVFCGWNYAQAYCAWLSRQTGQTYRLLSEAEWEYVCRAGTTTPFWWGDTITPQQAYYNGSIAYNNGAKDKRGRKTLPVGKVGECAPNPWGLYQVHGNVSEWVQDRYHNSYEAAPCDGSAWESGDDIDRMLRGGAWYSGPVWLRSAARVCGEPDVTCDGCGFRLARDL